MEENPADYLTRGTMLEKISSGLKAWWEGPAFLFDSQCNWPQLNMVFNPDNDMTELKRIYVIGKEPSTTVIGTTGLIITQDVLVTT